MRTHKEPASRRDSRTTERGSCSVVVGNKASRAVLDDPTRFGGEDLDTDDCAIRRAPDRRHAEASSSPTRSAAGARANSKKKLKMINRAKCCKCKTPPDRSWAARAVGGGDEPRFARGTSFPERIGRTQIGLLPGGSGRGIQLASHPSSNKTTLPAESDARVVQ